MGQNAISADGRYVTFWTDASNLVNVDINAEYDSFVHDRQTGKTSLISRHSGGTPGAGRSLAPTISDNGRYIAYNSSAANLVDDASQVVGVYLYDLLTAETTLVSRHSNGNAGGGSSSNASISASGRVIAIESDAINLVDDDGNNFRDVFVRDRGE